jgi:hypothetical protein
VKGEERIATLQSGFRCLHLVSRAGFVDFCERVQLWMQI